MSILTLKKVSYADGEKQILSNIDVSIQQGEFLTVIGSSGSGKTTFFRLLSSLISPTSGSLYYREKEYSTYSPTILRAKIAYSFQTPILFGKTVKDNMDFPFYIHKEPVDLQRINDLFALFHLDNSLLTQEVTTLSGGEKQRLSLIRSLLYTPDILLLDEATSALDPANTKIVEQAIDYLHQNGLTILWITHNPEQNRNRSNRILLFKENTLHSKEVQSDDCHK